MVSTRTEARPTAEPEVEEPEDGAESADHRRAPRRRGEALLVAIFDATLAELAEVGYNDLTMERVASRARASKGSLYRRWASRVELVLDAMEHSRPHRPEEPDTGDTREDLLRLLRSIARMHSGPSGEASQGLMIEVLRNPELMHAVRTRFMEPIVRSMLEILRRGAVRGDVRPTALTHRIAAVGPDLLRQYRLLHGTPIPDEVVLEIVDEVLMPLLENHRR
ncbi:MAG TPA: TetR/AcrR family transcriptional regulator [Pseudonocardia sp.]|jgi:AcrR family transcriptional regulator|nr:TetR/AcrR family transcriptional regulator [Pseudonocardia sp.]